MQLSGFFIVRDCCLEGTRRSGYNEKLDIKIIKFNIFLHYFEKYI